MDAEAHGGPDLHGREVAVEALAGEELVEDDTHREDVGARVDDLAAGLLGGHIGHLAEHDIRLGAGLLETRRRQAEVDELHFAFVAEHHVCGRHIAMHEEQRLTGHRIAQRVGVVERREHLGDHCDHQSVRQHHDELAGALHDFAQVATRDVLHAEEVRLILFSDVVDLTDVAMIELDHHARFVGEARHILGIAGVMSAQRLHHRQALHAGEAPARGQEDVAHAAARDGVQQHKRPKRPRKPGGRCRRAHVPPLDAGAV